MKKNLSCVFALQFLIIVNFYGQSKAPTGPGGSSLFRKGECERVATDFNVCTYCVDKELTNCAEYWCTNDGTCEKAPFIRNPANDPRGVINGVRMDENLMLTTRKNVSEKDVIFSLQPGTYISVSFALENNPKMYPNKPGKGDYQDVVDRIKKLILEHRSNSKMDIVSAIKKQLAGTSAKKISVKKYS